MTSRVPLKGDYSCLGEALVAAGEQFCDIEAYVDGDVRITFGGWMRRAGALAARLRSEGVQRGDIVALMLPPSVDYAVCFAAAALIGAVTTGLNTRLGPMEVNAVLDRARPRLIIRDEGLDLAPVTAIGSSTVWSRSEAATASEPVVASAACSFEPTRVARTDRAVIIWTSGTTGLPKGAWFDHDGLRAAVATAGVMSEPFDRRLATTPFAHAGYMAKLWEQAAWATTIVVGPQPWNALDTVRLIAEERITVAGGVPTQWAKIIDCPLVDSVDLSSLRICLSATAPAPPELVERVTYKLGCPLVVRYAMTESPSITGTEPGDSPEVQYRTVGKPQVGVEIDLRGDDDQTVAAGSVGRIHVRSDCAMRGYLNDPAATSSAFADDGWLRSGDLGHLDALGNLVLDGRVDDMYIRGGYNVYPLEVEHVLDEHPEVSSSSVIGVDAPVIGQIGCAFVVASDPHRPPAPADLVAWCKARLADYKAPDRIVYVDVLPLTSMMKVDKSTLHEYASRH